MNVFFELADCAVGDEGKYLAVYNTRRSAVIGGAHRRLMLHSNRVWVEEDTGVRFLKHRFSEASTTPVDMKEFFWIKLKSATV